MTWIVLLIVLALAGLGLVFLGLRGRRTDDHPLCRRCGFDLTGNPDAAVCTECGADLTRPRAVKVGHRGRRRTTLALGVALLVPCLLVGGLVGYVVLRGVDVQAYKPAWLLVRELRSSDVPTRDAAVAEFDKRLKTDAVAAGPAAEVVDWALAMQADQTVAWDKSWGGLVEAAHADAKASDEQWQRFGRQALVPVFHVRPTIRRGDGLPMQVEVESRLGPAVAWQIYLDVDALTAGGAAAGRTMSGGMTILPMGSTSNFSGYQVMDGRKTADLPVGPARATAHVKFFVGEANVRGGGGSWTVPDATADMAALVKGDVTLSADFAVRGRDEPPGFITTDEARRPLVEARVWVSPVRWVGDAAAKADGGLGEGGKWTVGVREASAGPSGESGPPLDYRLVLRLADGTEIEGENIGSVYSFADPALGSISSVGYSMQSLDPSAPKLGALGRAASALGFKPPTPAGGGRAPETVTLLLRPEATRAALRMDGVAIWGRDVVFENVPVARAARDAAGHDWRTGPWQSPGGATVDPDADMAATYGRAATRRATPTTPATQPAD